MDPLLPLASSPAYLDELYRQYVRDPSSLGPEWAGLFERFDRDDIAATPRAPSFLTKTGAAPRGLPKRTAAFGIQIYDLVHTFRGFGHLIAAIDPLGRGDRHHPFLDLGQFGFTDTDLESVVNCEGFHGCDQATVREYIELLRETYCGPIGVEYMDVTDAREREWIERQIEPIRNRPRLSVAEKKQILAHIIAADTFEETLQAMYPTAKRFSLEGATTLITLLQVVTDHAADADVQQMVVGMAHRGRLNVLANILRKPLDYILAEFEGRPLASEVQGYGDVKYHLGYSHDYVSPRTGKSVHLSLAFNPSHLEAVNPVVEGIVRAKQDRIGDRDRTRVIPVLIHGDAAFAGQGVVAETLNFAEIPGYSTGGTLHIIVNNQIGFTAEPQESRSTRYASDIAKMVRAPVFHVNADHPEAVALVGQLALSYRQTFHHDVVIDLVCFRRHGHNELDDASFTQPVMAKLIKAHSAVSRIYGEKLKLAGTVSAQEVTDLTADYRRQMESARESARAMPAQVTQRFGGAWRGLGPAGDDWSADTAVPAQALRQVAQALTRVPDGFNWHPRLHKLIARRAASILDDEPLDWGTAEGLAYGTLVCEGTRVRLSGQDSGRGTFSHRHGVYTDMETGARHVPLDAIAPDQARFEILNSPLSEEAVLGFDYGYSSADPWTLVIWEAQFGDFVNGAQVVIDQLIASAEYKWGRMNGLVLLLPHGYEGQGPEHSSARLERFLELCAEDNMQVVYPTTPAQIFHVLRRQAKRSFRKPLVVMSPKSLLRHPRAVSRRGELETGTFLPVIDDRDASADSVRTLLLCSGKIYYALAEEREARAAKFDGAASGGVRGGSPGTIDEFAIARLEQLYPFPKAELLAVFDRYPRLRRITWVQEEPRNMGAWRALLHRFEALLPRGVAFDYAGRQSAAVPATGSLEVHHREERALIEHAFRDEVVAASRTEAELRAEGYSGGTSSI